MDGSSACRDQQRLLLAAEPPSEAKPVAAEAEAFAGAVGALGRHKLGLDAPGSSESNRDDYGGYGGGFQKKSEEEHRHERKQTISFMVICNDF